MLWITKHAVTLTFVVTCIFTITTCNATSTVAIQQLALHSQPNFADLPQLLNKRLIKVLVVNHPAYYFIDQSQPRGMAYELMRAYERQLATQYQRQTQQKLQLNILFIPVASADIVELLAQGYGDIAIGPLLPTQQQQQRVKFSQPVYDDNQLLLFSHASNPDITDISQLSGQEIWVAKNSRQHQQLQAINRQILNRNLVPIYINLINENVEHYEVLDMINNNKKFMTLGSSHDLALWSKLYNNVKHHPRLQLDDNLTSSWAVHGKAPLLSASLDQFISQHKKGTKLGNILHDRYLVNHPWLTRIIEQTFEERYLETESLIKKYAKQYQFDWQIILAQAYQESRLNQKAISHRGAVGVMQVLPTTAREPYVNIPDISGVDANIHAGIKYLHFMQQRYFSTPEITPLDSLLLTLAAYNAGPAKLRRLRQRTQAQGLDPNVWFDNVEVIARQVSGKETVTYVNNIYRFYLTYLLASGPQIDTAQLRR